MGRAPRDPNRVPFLVVASSANDEAEVILWGDPTTHRLLMDAALYLTPTTSGGLTIYRNIDLDETGVNVKATAGQLYGWYLYNTAATVRYVKLYNKATAPIVGTDVPVTTLPIPAYSAANVEYNVGIAFATGIGIGATTALADNSTAAPSTNDVIVNIFYY